MEDDLDCTKALLALYEFLDGELTLESRRNIAGHLDGCPHCFSVFDFEAELRIVVRSRLRGQVPPALLKRIAEAIEREAGSTTPPGALPGRSGGGAGGVAPGFDQGPLPGPGGAPRLGPNNPGFPGLSGS